MKTLCGKAAVCSGLLGAVLLALPAAAVTSVNNWINPGSGYWEDASSWSLGVSPDQTQSIWITNPGWKAVALGANTAQNFPQSMQVQDLHITSPTNSYNTLLLNFSGLEVPLQATSLSIGSNSAVVVQGSSLAISGSASVGGSVNQGDYSSVQVGGQLQLIDPIQFANDVVPPAAYYLTNGTLSVGGGEYLGGFQGPGNFVQYGGTHNTANIGVSIDGEYDISGGQLTVTNGITVGFSDYADYAHFYQYGGSVNGDVVVNGNYVLNGGTIAGHMQVVEQNSYQRVDAHVLQNGGTNHATSLELGYPNQFGGAAHYTLSNGIVHVDSSVAFNGGQFSQYNGQNTIVSNLVMQGLFVGVGSIYAEYLLVGGTLSVGGLTELPAAHFIQGGGSNLIAGDLVLGPAPSYPNSYYDLTGGTLAAKNISIGAFTSFYHTSGNVIHSGILTLAQGTWYAANGDHTLGVLQLGGPNTNSTITFPVGSSILRLANSGAQSWASGAVLTINNWHGSTSGGGATQLYFGSNSSGLSPQQLAQIQFSASSNSSPAMILATGEVVPNQGSSIAGPTNSWINPISGNWDQASNWSLGVLPGSSQSVMITNPGSKTVAINASTPVNFPGSMTVSNLTIRTAFGGATNTLLLNNFGTAVPLTVSNGLTLQDNAQIVNFNSGLAVQSGTIIVANSQISQDGGFVRTTNAPMYLQSAEYDLTNGIFEGGQVNLGLPGSGLFNQYGGSVIINSLGFGGGFQGGGGLYALYGGELSLPNGLLLYNSGNSSSSYFQAGGTNRTPQLSVESLGMTLNGGLLADNDAVVMGGYYGSATIQQNGGTHVVTNSLGIVGGASTGASVRPATYSLNGGTLSAHTVELNANQGDSLFVQSNATTRAGTFYAHSLGYFGSFNDYITLTGGSLTCSNFTLDDGHGSLTQYGGTLVVSNLLTITGYRDLNVKYYGSYTFTGGTVTASNIDISGNWVVGDGSTNRISNPGFFSLSHLLQIGNAVEQLGRFILATNSTIDLAGSASRLSFANSSGETWTGGATLVILDWNGNPSGGGAEQLKFGNNQSALTANQLSQMRFQISSNLYQAKILSTGEVVPDYPLGPPIGWYKQGTNLVLNWPSGWILQSATNVAGPYADVSGATAPYTYNMTLAPRQFFRLRQ